MIGIYCYFVRAFMILTRLVLPIVSLVFLGLIGFFGLANYAKNQANDMAHDHDIRILRAQFHELSNQIETVAQENAWWDLADEKINRAEPDIEWIEDTYGASVSNLEIINGVIVYSADAKIIYSHFQADEKIENYFNDPEVIVFLSQFTAMDQFSGHSDSAVLIVGKRIFILGASMIQSTHRESTVTFKEERRPVAIYMRELNGKTLQAFGNKIAIEKLEFVEFDQERYENSLIFDSSFSDKIFNNETQLALIWKAKLPGTKIFEGVFWQSVIVWCLVIIAFLIFLIYAKDMVVQLDKTNKLKSEFLANMSHELRTPLNAVIGFSEIMTNEYYGEMGDKRYKEHAQHILDGGQHLLAIINDILDLSKVEANKWQLYIESFHVYNELEGCVAALSSLSDEKNITIELSESDSVIKSDTKLFRQIVINILSNAIKFTAEGGQITIKTISCDKWEKVSISDNGIGMSKEGVADAKNMFTQNQGAFSQSHNGTGLGIPLVYKFVDLLGGKIDIQSEKGVGTTFEVAFPRASEGLTDSTI